jgi:two-component system cell cycle sensor histidine kinase/response regulator CckA
VLVAEHGADALRVSGAYDGPIHLLVTDVIMPGIGGRELADRLLQFRPALRVLYLSGYTDDSVMLQGVLASEMAFLQKPFAGADLAQKIRDVLASLP